MSSSPAPQQNVWFSVSIGLIGIILGYSAATITGGGLRQGVQQTPPSAQGGNASLAPEPTPEVANVPAVDPKTEHVLGNPDAKISLVTYSDYDCPFSKRHHPTIAALQQKYGDKVNFIYRHFPLPFHQYAQKKAEAAECVAELGGNVAFWKFTDKLFGDAPKGEFTTEDLAPLAKQVGISEAAFKKCYDGGKYTAKVNAMMQEGSKGGISGTPGNVLIDNVKKTQKLLVGAQPVESFSTAIDAL